MIAPLLLLICGAAQKKTVEARGLFALNKNDHGLLAPWSLISFDSDQLCPADALRQGNTEFPLLETVIR